MNQIEGTKSDVGPGVHVGSVGCGEPAAGTASIRKNDRTRTMRFPLVTASYTATNIRAEPG